MAAQGLGGAVLQKLLPKPGRAAKLALLQARRGDERPIYVAPDILLHEADGAFTCAVDVVLRRGGALVR